MPFQDDSHFKTFVIKFRNKESEDDVKTILSSLEKDELLFNLIPITFNEELEGETQTSSLFIERKIFINIIWDFILLRFFSEPEGLAKCYYAEFKRLDKFCRKLNTPVADSEIIVDIFKYCVNINANLLKQRDIEIVATDATTNCENTDVVMQETLPPRVLDQLGSASLADLILSPAKVQMSNRKPILQKFN